MSEGQNRTRLKKKRFLELFFKLSGNVKVICEQIDISRNTYYEWMKKDKVFADKVKNEEEGLIDFVEGKLMNLINDKNIAAVIFFLKTKGKKRGYIESAEHIHSGGVVMEISDKFLPKRDKDGKVQRK